MSAFLKKYKCTCWRFYGAGLAAPFAGPISFENVKAYVDEVVYRPFEARITTYLTTFQLLKVVAHRHMCSSTLNTVNFRVVNNLALDMHILGRRLVSDDELREATRFMYSIVVIAMTRHIF